MRFVLFTQSLMSCWNHGNAHFLRGIARELLARGHSLRSFEPEDGWSRSNLITAQGAAAASGFATCFPELVPHVAFIDADVDAMLQGADVVLVHEWTDPALVAAIGRRRAQGGQFTLLFHDTHHRAVSDPDAIFRLDLSGYDAVLAFGNTLSEVYRRAGWGDRVFTWHEAADTRLFQPPAAEAPRVGAVFIGNWGDNERSEELRQFLLHPAASLNLPLDIYGVRYPDAALKEVAAAGGHHRGWVANACVPGIFARHAMTVHVPRRFYATHLPGIPTIRVFEVLACGIPLICAPWQDSEALFQPGEDYLVAHSPSEMQDHMRALAADGGLRRSLSEHGLATIRARHSCGHRVDALMAILERLQSTERKEAA